MNNVKYFDHNTLGKDYVVGDIHGMYDELIQLLKLLNFNVSFDRLFSVGDLCDRGPHSMKCLMLNYENWFHAVRGNHEDMMIDSYHSNHSEHSYRSWLYNGGQWSLEYDEGELKMLSLDIHNLSPYIIVIGKDSNTRYNIVHAELLNNKDGNPATDKDIDTWNFDDDNIANMNWGRSIAQFKQGYTKPNNELSTIIVGHTPIDTPYKVYNHVNIDTGAVFNGKFEQGRCMTIYELISDKIYRYNLKTKEMNIIDGRLL